MKVLMIDNYDSFTFNLVQYLSELGAEVLVHRNDEITLAAIETLAPERIMISPGPGTPDDAGLSIEVIRQFGPHIPLLGVCLGHQAIAQAFGGRIIRAKTIMHGKVSPVLHHGSHVFNALPSPLTATRYHSLVIEQQSLPECLTLTAWTETAAGGHWRPRAQSRRGQAPGPPRARNRPCNSTSR